jgi:hypothetical protein
MPDARFTTEVSDTKVIVTDATDGHVFRFPILSNGTVSLQGSRIRQSTAKHDAGRYLFEANNAGGIALGVRILRTKRNVPFNRRVSGRKLGCLWSRVVA